MAYVCVYPGVGSTEGGLECVIRTRPRDGSPELEPPCISSMLHPADAVVVRKDQKRRAPSYGIDEIGASLTGCPAVDAWMTLPPPA